MIKSVTDPVTVANELRPVLLKLARNLRRELHHLDVSAGQLSILAEIAKSPGIGIRGLSDSEGVSAARMSKAVEALVSLGLAERHEGADRRRVGLVVTERGASVLESVKSTRTAWLADRLKNLAPEELARVDEAVVLLAKLLEPGE
jgi:DNA-binding MarR family transcriptional regulator